MLAPGKTIRLRDGITLHQLKINLTHLSSNHTTAKLRLPRSRSFPPRRYSVAPAVLEKRQPRPYYEQWPQTRRLRLLINLPSTFRVQIRHPALRPNLRGKLHTVRLSRPPGACRDVWSIG